MFSKQGIHFKSCLILLAALVAVGCKHPIQIRGEGDIAHFNLGAEEVDYACRLEDQVQLDYLSDPACEIDVQSDYVVYYYAIPRPGWKFVGWEGPCKEIPIPELCHLNTPASSVQLWDSFFPDTPAPVTIAIFEADGATWDEFNWDEANWQ